MPGYNGYLIKVGGSNGVPLPMEYIKLEGYNITPNQRMESEAKRSVTGVLVRSTVSHTATKVEFTTPHMTDKDVHAMMGLFGNAWISSLERKLNLQYYDMETGTYKTGTFYMPDIQFVIDHIDGNIIYYKETTIKFIEY